MIKPKILILDDSTSSVEVETEFKIQSALKTLMQNKTTFIITQRISTIRDADKILVMDRGRIIGLGPHEALIEQYRFWNPYEDPNPFSTGELQIIEIFLNPVIYF